MFFLLLGCPSPGTESDPKDSSSSLRIDDVEASSTAKETVFRLAWTTPVDADARVEYGTDGALDHTLALADGADPRAHGGLLVGLGAGETWTVRAVSEATDGSGDVWASDPFTIDVPPPPSDLPGYAVTVPDASGALEGFYLLTNAVEGDPWVTIVDHDGRAVWWGQGDADGQVCEAWLSADGQSVMWVDMGASGGIHVESLDGEEVHEFPLDGVHHDFYPMPDGTIVTLLWDEREFGGVNVMGDQLVELAADGTVARVVWTSWDDWLPDAETLALGNHADWTHSNSVWYDPDADEYVVSVHNFSAIIGIDRETGGIDWTVGGPYSDVELGTGEGFYYQHSARRTADGILVFNNRDYEDDEHGLWSEAVEYAVDVEAGTYDRTWSYDAEQMVFTAVLGNADELEDGGRLVGFGGAGRLVRLSAADEVVFQIDGDLGSPFGYVHWIPTFGGAVR